MDKQAANKKMIYKLMFRLLPFQIFLAALSSINGMISSYFASNFVGVSTVTAMGLYGPIKTLLGALNTILFAGATIICGKNVGQNRSDKVQGIFSLNLVMSVILACFFTVFFLVLGLFDLTGFLCPDASVRPVLNRYLLGTAVGIFPYFLGNTLPPFLIMENRSKQTRTASFLFIAVSLVLNWLFVCRLQWGTFGLTLASSLGQWVFLAVQAEYYLSGKSDLRFSMRSIPWSDGRQIIGTGIPGALSAFYKTLRGFLINALLTAFVGSAGISAVAASQSLLAVLWALPLGMAAVSRLLISVSVGEEDRQTLTDIMRVMFRRYLPLLWLVCIGVSFMAVPLTRILFRDTADPVYKMTVWAMRIRPLSLPLTAVVMHFIYYGQAAKKQIYVRVLSILEGVVFIAGFTALLIRPLGVNAVYIAEVLKSIGCVLVIVLFAHVKNRHFPRNMDELMMIPPKFGVSEADRMDLTLRTTEDVVTVSERVQTFCLEKGLDHRRAMLSALALEEMAANVVEHGFPLDQKSHTVDIRVVYKDGSVILRIRDDCKPFDPTLRKLGSKKQDVLKNVGIKLVLRSAQDVQYQNIMGLNVLTVRV